MMQHEKFQSYTLKINTIIWHRKKNSDNFWTGVYKSTLTLVTSAVAKKICLVFPSFLNTKMAQVVVEIVLYAR